MFKVFFCVFDIFVLFKSVKLSNFRKSDTNGLRHSQTMLVIDTKNAFIRKDDIFIYWFMALFQKANFSKKFSRIFSQSTPWRWRQRRKQLPKEKTQFSIRFLLFIWFCCNSLKNTHTRCPFLKRAKSKKRKTIKLPWVVFNPMVGQIESKRDSQTPYPLAFARGNVKTQSVSPQQLSNRIVTF